MVREYLLYIKVGTESLRLAQAYVTPCFSVDQSFWQEREGCQLHVIGRSPSLVLAFSLRELVNAQLERRHAASKPLNEEGLAELRELAISRVRETSALYGREMAGRQPLQGQWFQWKQEDVSVALSRCNGSIENAEKGMGSLLEGRGLLWEEIETLMMKRAVACPDMTPILQRMVLAEKAEWRPGVRLLVKKSWWKHRLDLVCDRCGSQHENIELTVCHTCGQGCAYCTVCLGMGRSKCCTPYVLVPSRSPYAKGDGGAMRSQLCWTGSYSKDQAVAAEQARRYVANPRPGSREFLIWAVCGAGKTELLFPSVSECLAASGRVLIATPRKDVVLELAPRVQRVFPHASVIAIHGSSQQKWEDADITIATTHQVMRYYHRFPLVVLDEADAFPYHNNPMLYRAVSRAVQPGGKLLYLSATPPRYLQKRLVAKRRGGFKLDVGRSLPLLSSSTHVLLPGRYHGTALPVPKAVTIAGLHKRLKSNRPIAPLLELVRDSLQSERQLFLFVPRIDDVDKVLAYLTKFFPSDASLFAGVHAADSLREGKVVAFREKRYRVMVTTTILERGVTIARSDVAVIGAEVAVFDEASLVQIAGRVGRSVDDPAGTVLFLQADRSAAVRAAIGQIRRMNQLAEKLRSREEVQA
ncbi:DEAD/DEAH box helicase [Brevibacillus choshinensis]|uniref:DEAD/DEAH box helicase family protein n=1 Tax=Brevibacillus choshinensis TaxID=54911 RepID=A0ABX7FPT4_BRECH|nr:DEAD/DEAH box helicase [Brevibacillus choshinensis]QRG67326.1 DEAD/DEAH box helicase family protein [Brevibacillus choshinensis]